MTPIYLTKKARKQMRERMKKKRLGEKLKASAISMEEFEKSCHTTRASVDACAETEAAVQKKAVVQLPAASYSCIVPPALSTEEARKFRKEARRKARSDGRDASKLQFVEQNSTGKEGNKKKRKFPNINELVKQQSSEKAAETQPATRLDVEKDLSESRKNEYVALDCEMVGIGANGKQSALARVSLVNWHGETLYDTFVQVPQRITDFRTHVSGVTPKLVKRESAVSALDCRERVASLLMGKILVGHALKNDLDALILLHPKHMIRDTAKYRPFQKQHNQKWRPRKLRDLAKEHLNATIQQEGKPHDSVEDARATMDLFKLVRNDWEKELKHDKH